jgi:hypothetical protein
MVRASARHAQTIPRWVDRLPQHWKHSRGDGSQTSTLWVWDRSSSGLGPTLQRSQSSPRPVLHRSWSSLRPASERSFTGLISFPGRRGSDRFPLQTARCAPPHRVPGRRHALIWGARYRLVDYIRMGELLAAREARACNKYRGTHALVSLRNEEWSQVEKDVYGQRQRSVGNF